MAINLEFEYLWEETLKKIKRGMFFRKKYFKTRVMVTKQRMDGVAGPFFDQAYFYFEGGYWRVALLNENIWDIPAPNYDYLSRKDMLYFHSPKKGVWIPRKFSIDKGGNIDVPSEELSAWRLGTIEKGQAILRPEKNTLMNLMPIFIIVGLGISIYFVFLGGQAYIGWAVSQQVAAFTNEIKDAAAPLKETVENQNRLILLIEQLISDRCETLVIPEGHPSEGG